MDLGVGRVRTANDASCGSGGGFGSRGGEEALCWPEFNGFVACEEV